MPLKLINIDFEEFMCEHSLMESDKYLELPNFCSKLNVVRLYLIIYFLNLVLLFVGLG